MRYKIISENKDGDFTDVVVEMVVGERLEAVKLLVLYRYLSSFVVNKVAFEAELDRAYNATLP